MISQTTTTVSILATAGIATVVAVCRAITAMRLGRAAIEKTPPQDVAKALGAVKCIVDSIRTRW